MLAEIELFFAMVLLGVKYYSPQAKVKNVMLEKRIIRSEDDILSIVNILRNVIMGISEDDNEKTKAEPEQKSLFKNANVSMAAESDDKNKSSPETNEKMMKKEGKIHKPKIGDGVSGAKYGRGEPKKTTRSQEKRGNRRGHAKKEEQGWKNTFARKNKEEIDGAVEDKDDGKTPGRKAKGPIGPWRSEKIGDEEKTYGSKMSGPIGPWYWKRKGDYDRDGVRKNS